MARFLPCFFHGSQAASSTRQKQQLMIQGVCEAEQACWPRAPAVAAPLQPCTSGTRLQLRYCAHLGQGGHHQKSHINGHLLRRAGVGEGATGAGCLSDARP